MAISGLFKPPDCLLISDNVAQDWILFKEQFKLFLIATESDYKSEEVKIAQLLNVIGREALSIYHTLKSGDIKSLKLVDVNNEFDKHFPPTRNITY